MKMITHLFLMIFTLTSFSALAESTCTLKGARSAPGIIFITKEVKQNKSVNFEECLDAAREFLKETSTAVLTDCGMYGGPCMEREVTVIIRKVNFRFVQDKEVITGSIKNKK